MAGSLYINSGSTLDLGTTTGNNFAVLPTKGVSGGGLLKISSSVLNCTFPAADFGDFLSSGGGTVEYYTTGGVSITIPTASSSGLSLKNYNNLILTPANGTTITLPDVDLTVYGNLTDSGGTTGKVITTGNTHTYTINGNLAVKSDTFQYRNGAIQTINVLGNTTINTGASFNV